MRRLSIVFGICLASQAAGAEVYRFLELPSLDGNSVAFDLNNNRQIVGSSHDGSVSRAVRWDHRGIVALSAPSDGTSEAEAINRHGDIAGSVNNLARPVHWDNAGTARALPQFVSGDNMGEGISDDGWLLVHARTSPSPFISSGRLINIHTDETVTVPTRPGFTAETAGWSALSGNAILATTAQATGSTTQPFIFEDFAQGRVATNIGRPPGDTLTLSRGISDQGSFVVGSGGPLGNGAATDGWVWRPAEGGTATLLQRSTTAPGRTLAWSVNEAGTIIGFAQTNGEDRAVIWTPDAAGDYGAAVELTGFADNQPDDWVLERALGINDRGDIVGRGSAGDGQRAFGLFVNQSPQLASGGAAVTLDAETQRLTLSAEIEDIDLFGNALVADPLNAPFEQVEWRILALGVDQGEDYLLASGMQAGSALSFDITTDLVGAAAIFDVFGGAGVFDIAFEARDSAENAVFQTVALETIDLTGRIADAIPLPGLAGIFAAGMVLVCRSRCAAGRGSD